MSTTPKVWGVHMGEHVGDGPIEGGYVGIGWPDLGDPKRISGDRDAFKAAMRDSHPNMKDGAVPVCAGIMYRFMHEMQAGDLVVYPSKRDRMINIGRFTGAVEYVSDDDDEYPNHRKVEWLVHLPRSDFSQSALYEIGAFITVFLIRNHPSEFLAKAGQATGIEESNATSTDADGQPEDCVDDDAVTAGVSLRAELTTADFIIRRIMAGQSGHQFEDLVAHLLECMGYNARVTPKSGDGGVDVIAHMDALGFQPPIVKVQCKRTTGQTGAPEANQLLGTLGEGEYGLLINLGSYSQPARVLERNRSKLRLIDGDEFVELLLENYERLAPRYRALIPLKMIHVPDLPSE